MNNIDKQIMDAERDLDAFTHGGCVSPATVPLQTPADMMHALLIERADALMGCTEGAPGEAETLALPRRRMCGRPDPGRADSAVARSPAEDRQVWPPSLKFAG